MTESWNLMLKAREILATPSHEGLANLAAQLFINRKDSDEYKAAKVQYDFCVTTFPNCLTRMLLMVYQDSSDDVFRSRSIFLLSELSDHGFVKLSPVALHDIKPLLISCLTRENHKGYQFKMLGRIVSLVANNATTLNNVRSWDELSDCILSLADTELLKAFHVFLALPPIKNWEFINRFMQRVMLEAERLFLDADPVEGDWSLALETLVKIGVQVLNSENRYESIEDIVPFLAKSLTLLEKIGVKENLQRRLEGLEKFVLRDYNMYGYNENQCRFVSELATELRKRSFEFCPSFVQTEEFNSCYRGERFGRQGHRYLKTLSSLQILEMVVSNELPVLDQELAIRQLNFLLSNHTEGKAKIDIAVIRELKPLLITCLVEKEIPETTFKILGQVVHHVAKEIFNNEEEEEDTWIELRDYITCHCQETEFNNRGMYIFRCLTMRLDQQGFVIPVMDSLLPEIRRMLNPPRVRLVDNFCWVLAFTSAFCAIIHMVEIGIHAESVEEIEEKMIETVTHLVERRMEIAIVTRAFKEMEAIVKEQLEWYTVSEFTFVKRLLRRLLAIEGMLMRNKQLLEGISVMVEAETETYA